MTNFQSLDHFVIANRGTVYVVKNPSECKHEELSRFFGDVLIDGKSMKRIGVESSLLPTIREGAYIGLLVSDEGT